jgi:prepilin-type N-terminal cleavage/methylation domain-containing protein
MKKKHGFTLVEMLVYIAVLTIALNFIYQIYYDSSSILKQGNERADYQSGTESFIEEFRRDVRNAQEVLLEYENLRSCESTLILRETQSIVVYSFDRSDSTLWKLNIQNGTTSRVGRWNFSFVRFGHDAAFPDMVQVYAGMTKRRSVFKSGEIFLCAGKRNGY